MDEKTFSEVAKRLREVDDLIKKLDPAIRADAFSLLKPYVAADTDEEPDEHDGPQQEKPKKKKTPVVVEGGGAEAFVRSQDISRPDLAVKAIAAWWFGEYGSSPITTADFRAIGDQIGVTLPQRPDKSVTRWNTDNGKPIFRNAGKGKLVPTVPHGELHFQNEYGVKKGTKTPPSDEL